MTKAKRGFQAIAKGIATETNPKTGKAYGSKAAGAILASQTRNASATAKRKNPNLKKVKG